MRVVVTGHLGYVGTVLTPMLQDASHAVFGIDSDLYARCVVGADAPKITQIIRDIRECEPGDFEGAHAVIHLAGLSNDPLGSLDPSVTESINHHGAVRVAECARKAGAERIVLASTCSVYGGSGQGWIDEHSPTNPLTPYAESKLAMERDVRALAFADVEVVAPRYATAFGPSPRVRFDLVVNNFAAWGAATGTIRLNSDGSAWRPLIHVTDIARAAIGAAEAPSDRVAGRVFNVGRTDMNARVRDIAQAVHKVAPECRVETAEGAGTDARCYRVNCDAFAATLPGSIPRHSVEDGARALFAFCREAGLTPEQFEGPDYARLAHVRWLMQEGLVTPELRSTS